MKNIACQLEHSVEAEVSPSFAWSWRTDIKNWDARPISARWPVRQWIMGKNAASGTRAFALANS
jgi:hypothetical protein